MPNRRRPPLTPARTRVRGRFPWLETRPRARTLVIDRRQAVVESAPSENLTRRTLVRKGIKQNPTPGRRGWSETKNNNFAERGSWVSTTNPAPLVPRKIERVWSPTPSSHDGPSPQGAWTQHCPTLASWGVAVREVTTTAANRQALDKIKPDTKLVSGGGMRGPQGLRTFLLGDGRRPFRRL